MEPKVLFQSEDFLNANMPAYYDYIRECLRLKNEVIGEALLDSLIERADGLFRKDQTTPYTRHLCDQAMYTFGLIGDSHGDCIWNVV